MNLNSLLGQLRILAITEGISYLLLGLTMPLKYSYQMGIPNKIIGMIHGILFITFCLWIIRFAIKKKWSIVNHYYDQLLLNFFLLQHYSYPLLKETLYEQQLPNIQ